MDGIHENTQPSTATLFPPEAEIDGEQYIAFHVDFCGRRNAHHSRCQSHTRGQQGLDAVSKTRPLGAMGNVTRVARGAPMGPGLICADSAARHVFLSEEKARRRPPIPVSHSICFGDGTQGIWYDVASQSLVCGMEHLACWSCASFRALRFRHWQSDGRAKRGGIVSSRAGEGAISFEKRSPSTLGAGMMLFCQTQD